MTDFEKYTSALKGAITPIAKIEFLNPDGKSTAYEISTPIIADGTLNVKFGNGSRRSATITLNNEDRRFDLNPNKIWFGQQVRLSCGILLRDGSEFYLPQGIFYVKNPEEAFEPTRLTTTLQLVDKWSYLDGSLFGRLNGIYQINVGDNLFVAIQQLLLTDRGNGIVLDSTPPLLDSYYKDKTVTLTDGSVVSVLEAPYTIRIDADKTYADVLLEIATMLVASIGYDCNGYLKIQSAQTDISDAQRPIRWAFSVEEQEFLGATYTHNMTEMYNDVKVVGATVNGVQVQARALNKNAASESNVNRIGNKTYTKIESKYTSQDMCAEMAKYELRRKITVPKTASFTTSPIYHIQENDLITLLRTSISTTPEKHLVDGFSLPIGGTNTMRIDTIPISEFDLYHNWLSSHDLQVLCANIGALKLKYGDPQTTVDLSNPYIISDIPAGLEVTFTVVTEPLSSHYGYTIHSATLNGAALVHNGVSCSFIMPSYDSNIVFQLSATNGTDLSFSYTGAYTDTTQVMNGVTYRLLTFTSSGTFTPNVTQLANGIIGDLWVRGAGGGGNSLAKGKNGYDDYEYAVRLDTTEILIGVGGATSSLAGGKGTSTSFDDITGAGGSGASSYSLNSEGSLSKIFDSITNTTNGAGGAIGANGQNGICYIRIVKQTA